jgi:hypothetical protein
MAKLARVIGNRRWTGVPVYQSTRTSRNQAPYGPRGGEHDQAPVSHRRLDGTFSGHSLRSGFATEGYAQGTPELAIMRHGRWRSASVMRGYVEEGSIWNDNAAARLGL